MNYSGDHQMLPYPMRALVVGHQQWKGNVELAPNCPRCDSSNTKFCYYNNYSLTQPRYFCKGCRRYWTKGGSLRNVPVGGGTRKSRRGKSSKTIPNNTTSSLLRPPQGCLRPDLALDGMVGSSCSSDAANSPPPAGGAVIDLAVLYRKYLNQCPPLEFNEESPSFVGGIDNCYDQINYDSLLSSSSTDVTANDMFLSSNGSVVPGLVCQEATYEEELGAVAGDNVMLGQNLVSMEDWSSFDQSNFESFYSM